MKRQKQWIGSLVVVSAGINAHHFWSKSQELPPKQLRQMAIQAAGANAVNCGEFLEIYPDPKSNEQSFKEFLSIHGCGVKAVQEDKPFVLYIETQKIEGRNLLLPGEITCDYIIATPDKNFKLIRWRRYITESRTKPVRWQIKDIPNLRVGNWGIVNKPYLQYE